MRGAGLSSFPAPRRHAGASSASRGSKACGAPIPTLHIVEQSVLFGRYRLLERAGAGGSAQGVARRGSADRGEVAVSGYIRWCSPIRPPAGSSNASPGARTLEGRTSSARDSHLTDDEATLVLDCRRTSLADHLAQHGKLPVGEAVAVVRDIAALADGAFGRRRPPRRKARQHHPRARSALLTDFGVARQDAEEIHQWVAEVTGHGVVVGSLRYMAPSNSAGSRRRRQRPIRFGHGRLPDPDRRPAVRRSDTAGDRRAQAAGTAPLTDVDPSLAERFGAAFPSIRPLASRTWLHLLQE